MSAEDREVFKKILNLEPHPEGNLFAIKWIGDRKVNFVEKTQHDGPRNVGSSINTLLTTPDFISWHRVLSDEIYFWHSGGVMKVHFIGKDGRHEFQILGDVLKNNAAQYQVVIPHDVWYAAEVIEGEHVLFSAVVMPGFEFKDWIAGDRGAMIAEFPQHRDLITRLTKNSV
ncbi:hypothetical protein LOTGIDRAFT_205189 [Lottia gigantea]|uniref:DUF985 domain-containing protein n=1 Tax=Lottia gigantea TaxID=225164 RepID=V4AUD6_LOTGI|nr:hypothetical protein LOTGIDRAFT_205189 [Lottia gigantea]ESP00913.1 hypothetical protein LOTGIDRAFT_205189 [Lottia gigantea]